MKNGLYYVPKLERDEIIKIEALENHHNLTKGISFKIDPQVLVENDTKSNHILYYEKDVLKGYVSVNCFGGEEIECAAIADNDENIIFEMYHMVLQKAKESKRKKLLFIIDAKDVFLANLVKGWGFQFSFAEYRMNFEKSKFHLEKENSISIQNATSSDVDVISYLEQDFSNPYETVEINENENPDIENTKIARQNGEIIGKIKVENIAGTVGIYGFVVDPKWRGLGYGKKILHAIIEEVLCDDFKKLYLEVETENVIALHLYESVGFQVQTKFDYYEVNK